MNILIHGVGKTGTTALFYTIRKALSGPVTEFFEPASLEFDADPQDPHRHVLAKVLLRETVPVPYERFPWKIMTVRDPRDILISRLLYLSWHAAFRTDRECMNAYLALLRAKERDPASIPLKDLFSSFAAFQRQHPYREYLQVLTGLSRQQELLASRSDFFVQRYEEFVDGRLEKLTRYLGGLDLNGRAEVHPDVARVARRKGYGDWRHWMTPGDVAFFRPMLAPSLRELGYEDDWELASVPTIDPRYCSEYAASLQARRIAHTATHWPPAPTSHAEVLAIDPESLFRFARAPALRVSLTPVGIEPSHGWAFSPAGSGHYAIDWDGGPIAGDVVFRFYLDCENPEPLTRLYLNFGEGFSEAMFLTLPTARGDNFVLNRFHRPVSSLRLSPVNTRHSFLLRDVQISTLA